MSGTFCQGLRTKSVEGMTIDEYFKQMLQNRYDYRKNQSFSRLIKLAEFRYNAYMEKIDYTLKRNLDRNQLERLAFWNFVKEGQNLFITGSSGT